MDDTLIVNKILYEYAKAQLYGYLRHYGLLQADIQPVLENIDKENFKTFGYSRQRFPDSFEKVLKHFVPEADAEASAIVRDFAETVFKTNAAVKPGILEAVDMLSAHYPVYIVTQGDRSVQESRLKQLPFKDKLSDMFIVDKKDKETYTDIAKKLGFKPEEVIMMGDSLRSDIVPSVEAGMQAVWIEADNWSLEAVASVPKERMYKFPTLLEAARQIVTEGTLAVHAPAPRKKLPKFKLG